MKAALMIGDTAIARKELNQIHPVVVQEDFIKILQAGVACR